MPRIFNLHDEQRRAEMTAPHVSCRLHEQTAGTGSPAFGGHREVRQEQDTTLREHVTDGAADDRTLRGPRHKRLGSAAFQPSGDVFAGLKLIRAEMRCQNAPVKVSYLTSIISVEFLNSNNGLICRACHQDLLPRTPSRPLTRPCTRCP